MDDFFLATAEMIGHTEELGVSKVDFSDSNVGIRYVDIRC